MNVMQLEVALAGRFSGEKISVQSVSHVTSHQYRAGSDWWNILTGNNRTIEGLPAFTEIRLKWSTGEYAEDIIVWTPDDWNGKFAGTAGGGMGTGGESYLTVPDMYSRGWNVPYAVMQGYTAATADANNGRGLIDHVLDRKTGKFHWELYENWRSRTTHHMTLAGKAVAEIFHDAPVEYSYMNGGSGGGRQSLCEAQEYPEDYDGIWASAPAINWNRFILGGLWPNAVMNTFGYTLTPKKIKYFQQCVFEAAGGQEKYYLSEKRPVFDPYSVVGAQIGGEKITSQDAQVMKTLWDGPHDEEGRFLWYGYRPGVCFWSIGNPITPFYYSLLRKKPKPLILSNYFARWIRQDPHASFGDITIPEFAKLFHESTEKLSEAGNNKADLSAFCRRGGKLIIDQGLNDALIPADSNIDYYLRMEETMGKSTLDSFCRFYLTPGDGHCSCYDHGPGLTQSAGIRALTDWVEHGIAPQGIAGAQVDKKSGEIIREKLIAPVENIHDWI